MTTLVELAEPIEYLGETYPIGVIGRAIHWSETRDGDGHLYVLVELGTPTTPVVRLRTDQVRRVDLDPPPAGDGGGSDESPAAWYGAHARRRRLPNGGNPG